MLFANFAKEVVDKTIGVAVYYSTTADTTKKVEFSLFVIGVRVHSV